MLVLFNDPLNYYLLMHVLLLMHQYFAQRYLVGLVSKSPKHGDGDQRGCYN